MTEHISLKESLRRLKMDYGRYRGHGFSAFAIFTHPSFITTFLFRIGTWLYIKNNIFAKIACIPIRLIYKLQACLSGIQLPLGTSVGGGYYDASFLLYRYSTECCNWRKLYDPSRSYHR